MNTIDLPRQRIVYCGVADPNLEPPAASDGRFGDFDVYVRRVGDRYERWLYIAGGWALPANPANPHLG